MSHNTSVDDIEKGEDASVNVKAAQEHEQGVASDAVIKNSFIPAAWGNWLKKLGVETRGMEPVPLEERNDMSYMKHFWFWLTPFVIPSGIHINIGVLNSRYAHSNLNVLPISSGSLATLAFGMGLRDAFLTIFFFNLLCCIPTALAVTITPGTGMRQSIAGRYFFGKYGGTVPVIFTLIGTFGFGVINSILGGQLMAAVSPNASLDWAVGIVITGLGSLILVFFGIKYLYHYEKFAWMVPFVVFLILIGTTAKDLAKQGTVVPKTTSKGVLGMAATIAGSQITWMVVSPDLAVYTSPKVSKWKIFFAVYSGLNITYILLMTLGAAMGVAQRNNPAWNAAYIRGNLAGLFSAMFAPLGGFGKFLCFLLSLSIIGNLSTSIYAKALNLQIIFPFLFRVPRYIMAIAVVVIQVPLAIVGAGHFLAALRNFLGLIGYWAAAYAAIYFIEHYWFRKADPSTYDTAEWNNAKALTPGYAALFALGAAWALAVVGMDKTWYHGPIGRRVGDLGFILAFATAAVVYPVVRSIEIRIRGKL